MSDLNPYDDELNAEEKSSVELCSDIGIIQNKKSSEDFHPLRIYYSTPKFHILPESDDESDTVSLKLHVFSDESDCESDDESDTWSTLTNGNDIIETDIIKTVILPKRLYVSPQEPFKVFNVGRYLEEDNVLSIQHSESLIGEFTSNNNLQMDYFSKSGDNYSVSFVSKDEIDLKIFYLDGEWKVTRRTCTLLAFIVYTIDNYGTQKININSEEKIDLMQGQKSVEIHIMDNNSNILQIIFIYFR